MVIILSFSDIYLKKTFKHILCGQNKGFNNITLRLSSLDVIHVVHVHIVHTHVIAYELNV